mgnify:CR=1 FL=1
MVYLKEGAQIVDMLNVMEAYVSLMNLENVRILKEMRKFVCVTLVISLLMEKYMLRCIQLARQGEPTAPPNPMVGAVIVHNNRIIGEGYHVRCGEAHAEVNAVRKPLVMRRWALSLATSRGHI